MVVDTLGLASALDGALLDGALLDRVLGHHFHRTYLGATS
jgi:hypothetical protein